MGRRVWLGLVAVVTAITAVLACRQTLGIDQYSNLTPTVCGLPYGTITCASCTQTSCCTESNACAADPSCASYASCFGQCNGDPRCWATCRNEYPANTPSVSALSACMVKSCETACRLNCGALAGYQVAPEAAAACQSCLVNNACSATRACAASSNCDAQQRCLPTCHTIDCFDACDVANGVDPAFSVAPDAGGGVWGTYRTARFGCSTQCELGSDWSCVGHVSWPTPKSDTITWNLWAKDYVSGAPTAGANVSVCSTVDCAVPLAIGVTNASGLASMPLGNAPAVGGGLDYGLNGFLRFTSPSIVPGYYYWGFPLSGSQINANAFALTPAELQQFYTAVGVPQDPKRGSVSAAIFDCQGASATGVTVTLDTADAMTRSFTPSAVAATITDSSGILIFTNVPLGTFQLTATPVALRKVAGKVSAYMRAGTGTEVLVYPTP